MIRFVKELVYERGATETHESARYLVHCFRQEVAVFAQGNYVRWRATFENKYMIPPIRGRLGQHKSKGY